MGQDGQTMVGSQSLTQSTRPTPEMLRGEASGSQESQANLGSIVPGLFGSETSPGLPQQEAAAENHGLFQQLETIGRSPNHFAEQLGVHDFFPSVAKTGTIFGADQRKEKALNNQREFIESLTHSNPAQSEIPISSRDQRNFSTVSSERRVGDAFSQNAAVRRQELVQQIHALTVGAKIKETPGEAALVVKQSSFPLMSWVQSITSEKPLEELYKTRQLQKAAASKPKTGPKAHATRGLTQAAIKKAGNIEDSDGTNSALMFNAAG